MSGIIRDRRIFSPQDNGGGGTGTGITAIVNTYADLPIASTVSNKFYWVSTSTGIHLTGLYYSNGTSYEFSPADDITVVTDYNALPAANTVTGQFYWCSNPVTHTTLFITFTDYNSGLYYSNGVTWELIPIPIQATQAETDAGTISSKYVTPLTLENFARLKNTSGTNTGNETSTSINTIVDGTVNVTTLNLTDKIPSSPGAATLLQTISYSNFRAQLKTYFDTIYQSVLGYTAENVANKATDFSILNNTKYPTTQAVDNSYQAKTNFTQSFLLGGM